MTEYSKNMLVLVGAYNITQVMNQTNFINKCMTNPVRNRMMHADHVIHKRNVIIQAIYKLYNISLNCHYWSSFYIYTDIHLNLHCYCWF